ncbi:hypothetical protein GCM10010528_07810 [Gordonia defluvii]|uniref:Uncharacterized protein n=1 Tax=Gordonia defluvii TaxID=283718 RepID=A0ABP6L0H5_9ACTN
MRLRAVGYLPRRFQLNRVLSDWRGVLTEVRRFTDRDRHRRRGPDYP